MLTPKYPYGFTQQMLANLVHLLTGVIQDPDLFIIRSDPGSRSIYIHADPGSGFIYLHD